VPQRERARAARLESSRDGTLDEHLGDVVRPYKGLCAFEFDDAALFFGRERQVERVLARLTEVRFAAVVGASGSGKSSFVRAGLLAGIGAATGGKTARVALLTPGADPLGQLAGAVGTVAGAAAPLLADDLRADRDALWCTLTQVPGVEIRVIALPLSSVILPTPNQIAEIAGAVAATASARSRRRPA
jgi:Novel STAND NTPase 1